MKKYSFIVLNIIISLSCNKANADDYKTEIDILCHCVTDCNRSAKCEWLFDNYLGLTSDSEDEVHNLFRQEILLIEIVDAGRYGCFTIFGIFNDNNIRTDVGFYLENQEYDDLIISEVDHIPTYNSRSKMDSDDLCIFMLP